MAEATLGKLQTKVTKLESKVTELRELLVIRKEKYRLLQMSYDYLEKTTDNKIENAVDKATAELKKENEKLKDEIERLKSLLNKDSNNSGIPTSQTPINEKKRIPNSREKTGKSVGGQKGHSKHKLNKFEDDELTDSVYYEVEKCSCGGKLKETGERTKDELDIEIRVKKTRHHFKEYECLCCGRKIQVPIPKHLKEENQYGSNVKALALSLLNEGCVSYNRTRNLINGFSSNQIDISEGFLVKQQKNASEKLDSFIKELRQKIIKEKIIHWDDTVIMINEKRGCLRFYGTEKLALYTAHEHKNKEGLDEDNILNTLDKETVVVHDHNTINYNDDYDFQNAECCVHLIRDLQRVGEELNHEWTKKLINLLKTTNQNRNEYINQGNQYFEEMFIEEVQSKYDEIIENAKKENIKDRNKYFGNEEKALINRLIKYKENYLMWVIRFDVPFSNNLSERSLRGSKTKMKVSGQFKNISNAEYYSNIKSYIETCKRNNINVHDALIRLSDDNPYSIEEILCHIKNSD